MGSTRLSRPTAAPASRASPLPQRRGLQFQSFRTTFRFHSPESSEKIPLACACPFRGIVSANRCKTAVGFSRPTCTFGARRHLREALFYGLRFMVAVRRALSSAPVSKFAGLLTCVRLPPVRFGVVGHALGGAGQGLCRQVAGYAGNALKQHAPDWRQARYFDLVIFDLLVS